MTITDQDDNFITCSRCGSYNIEAISEDNEIYGTGLYLNFGVIAGLDKIINDNNEYHCLDCNNEF